MIIFFDTSALIKRYIPEAESDNVGSLFEEASGIIVSAITKIEMISTIKRLFTDNAITEKESIRLKSEIYQDFNEIYTKGKK